MFSAAHVVSAGAYAAGSDRLKVGLIGGGGRGTGAAVNALHADPATELIAIADVFEDRATACRTSLQRQMNQPADARRVNISDEHVFDGFDAYKRVIDLCDVVLLATPPHFRPEHITAAIEADRHVFCEKPVAVDVPGLQAVMKASELAKEKKRSLVSGLAYRYHDGMRAMYEKIHDGAIGDIVTLQCSFMTGGVWNPRRTREQCSSEMEYQLRNWYYYTWLSGDFNVEQHIHSLDKMLWAMQDVPPSAVSGTGGRQVRTEAHFGNIYDHFNVVYEWANGVKLFSRCRHWAGTEFDVSDYIVGSRGRADVMKQELFDLDGNPIWKFDQEARNPMDVEHEVLFSSIRSGEPVNNGDYMCKSTLMAISGRLSAYTGQRLTWDKLLQSKEDLSPPAYDWSDIPVPPVAVPGATQFV